MARLLTLEPGTIFAGEYRVIAPLAEGGMGSVYEVEQPSTGAVRALKIMHPQLVTDEGLRTRFVREAKVGALIESDHVVQTLGAGVDPSTGTPWLLMELLRGETLAAYATRRPGGLPLWEVREIFSQLCHALAAAHHVGVVHRDLKPENVFLSIARREGVPFTVKVLDFGIAKLLAEANPATHTAAIGTPLWMAPEQTEIGANVRAATDVWALGLLAFWLVTGFHYWRVANLEQLSAAALLREIVLEPIQPPSERAITYGKGDRIPPGFDAWFARCVCRDIEARFPDAKAARDALEQVISVGTSSPMLGSSLPTPPPMQAIVTQSSAADGASATVVAPQHLTPQPRAKPSLMSSTGTPHEVPEVEEAEPPVPITGGSRAPIIAAAVVLVLGVGAWIGIRASSSGGAAAPSTSISVSSSASKVTLNMTAPIAQRPCPPGMAGLPGGTLYVTSKSAQVSLDSFCMDVHEVTVGDYEACVKKGHCNSEALSSDAHCNFGIKGKEKHPINCVDWDQAATYCTAQSKRLPRTEEWEWAAHGGDRNTTFPWGDDPPKDQLCWSGNISRAALGTCESGVHTTGNNPFGVQDLAGNVSEWQAGEADSNDTVRPLLGDSWMATESVFAKDVTGKSSVGARVSARKTHSSAVGFRCASAP